MECPFHAGPATVFVFSHPNHEVAVWGLLRHLRPTVVFLTDGGGGKRLEETRTALADEKIDAVHLETPEAEYYEAFLRRDSDFFARAADRVADVLRRVRPERIFTDAVEFYNPVHDVALPISVAAASAALDRAVAGFPFFEIPLVHQQATGTGERYSCQEAPPDRLSRAIRWELPSDAGTAKLRAWTERYTRIALQMAPIVKDPCRIASVETVMVADSPLREPGNHVAVRYEWRGRRLKEEGKVLDVITRHAHFLPVAHRLLGEGA